MKVLVATEQTQGQRENDFCFVPEGELVMFGTECDREDIDGNCGCKRSMAGLKCQKATTTIMVAEMDVDLEAEIAASLIDGGWGKIGLNIEEATAGASEEVVRIAEKFPVGTILERRGNDLNIRQNPAKTPCETGD